MRPDRARCRRDDVRRRDASAQRAAAARPAARQVQMVFQDSYASLNPRLTVEDSIAFGPQVHGVPAREARARAHDLLRPGRARSGAVRRALSARALRRPAPARQHRPRARARAAPRASSTRRSRRSTSRSRRRCSTCSSTSRTTFGLTYVFISHDLNVVRFISRPRAGHVSRQGGRDRRRPRRC